VDKTKRQLGKKFRWWFQSRERLIFRWWFPSQVGLCALTNPDIIWGSIAIDGFWVVATKFSLAIFESLGTLCAEESTRQLWTQCCWWCLTRQLLSFWWWFLINQDCMRGQIQSSPVVAVSLIISQSAESQFSVTITEWTGTVGTDETKRQLGKQFRWRF
jgi:hypothetical protein